MLDFCCFRQGVVAAGALALLGVCLPASPLLAATVVSGSSGADVIDLSAEAGPFQVFGNSGNDVLTGSSAGDLIDGGYGNDQIAGGPGADTLIGNANDDTIDGGPGDDVFAYEGTRGGYDNITGGSGWDRLLGSDQDDTFGLKSIDGIEAIDGGAGYNTIELASNGRSIDLTNTLVTNVALIRGGYGRDQIIGSAGDDTIDGGPGNDMLDGGAGQDTARYSGSYIDYSITESAGVITISALSGNEGRDTLVRIERFQFADATYTLDDLFPPAGNGPPVANDDFAQVASGNPVSVDVLANDTDPDGDPMMLGSIGQPAHGTAAIGAPGTIVYQSTSGYAGSDVVRYTVTDARGLSSQGALRITVVGQSTDDAMLELLRAAPEGRWVKLNRNRFDEVWTPKAQRAEINGTPIGEPRKIISAWGSMAWDSNRGQLIIWGGGHANYAGNDVYRFDGRTLRWERASLPSRVIAPLGDKQFFAADGPMNAPISSHTYDNQEFLSLLDRFITFGGAKYNAGQIFVLEDGVTRTGPYLWDPSKAGADMVGGTNGSQVNPKVYTDVRGAGMWQNRDSVVRNGTGDARPSWFVNGTTAYTEENGRDVLYLSESPRTGGDLYRYVPGPVNSPGLDAWQLVGLGKKMYSDQGAGAIDPARGLYLRTARFSGAYGIVMWDLTAASPTNVAIRFLPKDEDGRFIMSNLHGMDFDPVRQVFVLWDGGPELWYLRPPKSGSPLATGNWTVTPAPVPSTGPAPSLKTSTGVLGKWKYASRYDVMIGLGDSYEGQVWAYKPVGWQPQQ